MVFYLAKVQNIIETTNYYCLFFSSMDKKWQKDLHKREKSSTFANQK